MSLTLLEEIKESLQSANSTLDDVKSSLDSASGEAQEAASNAEYSQASCSDAETYAENTEGEIEEALQKLDSIIQGENSIPFNTDDLQRTLNHINQQVAAIWAVASEAIKTLNSLLCGIDENHTPINLDNMEVKHAIKEEEQETASV